MILSLVTGGIQTLNAASFVLLAPGEALADYIACSSIYSVATWMNLWIIPTAMRFEDSRLPRIRQAQAAVAAAAAALTLATHPTAVGIAFTALIVIESLNFITYPLLFRSNTALTQRLGFVQALCATTALAVAALAFGGSPTMFCGLLALLSLTLLTVARLARINRVPLAMREAQASTVLSDIRDAVASPQLHRMLTARALEIVTVLGLGAAGALAPLIAFKVGLAVSNAIATNARRVAAPVIILTATAIYGAGLGGLHIATRAFPGRLPATVELLTPAAALTALPLMLAYLALLLAALRAPAAP